MRRFPLKVSKLSMLLKVGKEFKVLKMPKCLPKVIIFLMWKEVMRCRWFIRIGLIKKL